MVLNRINSEDILIISFGQLSIAIIYIQAKSIAIKNLFLLTQYSIKY